MDNPPTNQSQNRGSKAVSLSGKTVLVTRPRNQSEEITLRLESLGATVIHCPTIEVLPPDDWSQLDHSISRIREYDWIVFTSANGVRFFFGRFSERGIERAALEGIVVCAIGPVTASVITQTGIAVDVIARDSKAEGAFRSIVDHVGGEKNIKGLRFLIPRAKVAREFLPESLRKLGAIVDTVSAYQTVKPEVARESIIRIFDETRIDVVTFTSSSTLSNFASIVGFADLSLFLGDSLVACIGPITAETAADYGLRSIIQPDVYTAEALVEAILLSIGQA